MKEHLERIASMQAEARRLVGILAMWEKVHVQGIDPESVACFGFAPSLVTAKELRERGVIKVYNWSNPFNWPTVNGRTKPPLYNYVKLHDGTKVPLSPMIEAP